MSDAMTEFLEFDAGDALAETAEAESTAAPTAPTTPEAQSAQAAPPAWLEEVIDDPELPPSLRGVKVRDYIANTKRALTDAHVAGMEKNKALAKAQALEAFVETLQQKFNQPAPAAPSQAAPQTPRFDTEDDVVRFVQQREAQLRQSEIEPVRAEIQQLKQDNYRTASESARTAARAYLPNVSEDAWQSMSPAVAAIIWANQWDPRAPQTWAAAGQQYLADMAKIVPRTSVAPPPGAPPTGNGRPAGANGAPKARASTGNKRVDAELGDLIELWNRKNSTKVSFDEVAKGMANSRAMGEDD